MDIKHYLKDYIKMKARIKQLEIIKKGIADEVIEESPSPIQTFINKKGEMEILEAVQTSGTSDSTFSKVAKIEQRTNEVDQEIKSLQIQIDLIDNALIILNKDERIVIEETYFKGTKQKEIINIINVSMDTVSRYKRNAIKKMHKHINGHK